MMNLRFFKLDGAGNDFVGLDWRGKHLPTDGEMITIVRRLCNRHHGIGADGVILIGDRSEKHDVHFRMKYYNADGSCGSMCGNGARCAVVFAAELGVAAPRMSFLTDDGVYRGEVIDGGARVFFTDVPSLPKKRELMGPAKAGRSAYFLHVGVPHAVTLVTDDLNDVDVAQEGREIRFDPAFAPAGTNANFAQLKDGVMHVRTYERGVESETQACGSGSIASVLCWAEEHGIEGGYAMEVIPTGQISLTVEFHRHETGFTSIVLGGPAHLVFEGCVSLSQDFERLLPYSIR